VISDEIKNSEKMRSQFFWERISNNEYIFHLKKFGGTDE
jgi:hypothetical protein